MPEGLAKLYRYGRENLGLTEATAPEYPTHISSGEVGRRAIRSNALPTVRL